MRLLLDTHVLLWWLEKAPRLASQANDRIEDSGNQVFVSAVSVWEISIKQAAGKLKAPDDLLPVLAMNAIPVLPVNAVHAYAIRSLPRLHGDPFDRMLVAQAMIEELTLMTHDRRLADYALPCFMV